MLYIDITYKNNKYRGISIQKYRSFSCQEDNSFFQE